MRVDQLTFTRFLAAIAIVIFHYGQNIFPFNIQWFSFIFKQSNILVSYFFLLSGFVMILAYNNKVKINYLEFYKNRFFRLYPLYFLSILIVFIFVSVKHFSFDYSTIFLNLLAVQSWFPEKATAFNTPGWSISVEFFFYLIFPILFNLTYKNKKKLKYWVLISFLIFLLTQLSLHYLMNTNFYGGYPSPSFNLLFFHPLMHVNEFLIGNLAAILFLKFDKSNRNLDLSIIFNFILIVITLKCVTIVNFHNGLLSFLFIPFIILLSNNNGFITKIFLKKPLVILGEISFGIYILQFPVFSFSYLFFDKINLLNDTCRFYLAVFLLILIAYLSFIYIENPIRLKLKNSKNK
jgi:peptidoglycan/LPS O-acetylase OafA/YrhL